MRGKFLYIVLVLGIVVLVGISALLTSRMLDYSIPDPTARKVPQIPLRQTPMPQAVDSTYVRLDDPAPPKAPPGAAEVMPVPIPGTAQKGKQYPPAPRNAKGIGRVTLLIGEASVTSKAKKWRKLDGDSWISLDDTVQTGPESKLTIELNDGTVLAQGENCTMIIDEFIYKPDTPAEAGFAMRLVKGTCRMVTGFVTKINPERFEVRTRMATIGIRGCDTAITTSPERDDIYVIGLSANESVSVEAASNGTLLRNVQTGEHLLADKKLVTVVDIDKPQTMLSILLGKGIEQRRMTRKDFRNIIDMTSTLPTAGFSIHQSANEAIIQLQDTEE
jgi:hypothetical protein